MRAVLELSRIKKQLLAAGIDSIMLPLIMFLAICLRYDVVDMTLMRKYVWLMLATPVISIPIFIRTGLYRAMIRFIDQKIVYVVVLGVTLSLIVLVTADAIATRLEGVSRGVFGIYWVSAILYMVAGRFIARGYFIRVMGPIGGTRVAIYGAGEAGIQLASALRLVPDYAPVAFIDDSRDLQGATIAGIRVYSSRHLEELIAKRS